LPMFLLNDEDYREFQLIILPFYNNICLKKVS